MRDDLAKKVRIFLEEKGIDPLYAVTIFSILIVISYWRNIKNWEKTPGWTKGLIRSTIFGTCILVIASILQLLGLF